MTLQSQSIDIGNTYNKPKNRNWMVKKLITVDEEGPIDNRQYSLKGKGEDDDLTFWHFFPSATPK